jgi:phosphohistidine phosphatase SixA
MNRLVVLLFAATLPFGARAAEPAPAQTAVPPKPTFVEKAATPQLLDQIRKGGFVLYLRHGTTDSTRPDRLPSVDLDDCNTQRPLSDAGRALMRQVGLSIRESGIPLGRIIVSPMCRTKESAWVALGKKFEIDEALMYSANMTSEEKKPRIEALKKLLQAPVASGTNTLLVAHAPNLDDLIGFFVKPEGTMVVFRQGGPDGYEYLASIHPDDWARLRK